MNEPLVSIITPTYNREAWLPLTLESLVKQTYPRWECIVQNDAGRSVEHIVKSFNDPRIRYFENSVNLDLAQTRNVATSHATGDYFVMLDDDDGLMPECLEFRLWRMKKLKAEIVYSRVLLCYYEKINNGYKYLGEKIYWDCSWNPDLILLQNISPCNGIMYSRKAQELGGPFSVDLKSGEDWEHSIAMSRYFPFYETKIIDSYCSFRTSNEQMTGTRNFAQDTAKIFKKWRWSAIDKDYVKSHQNQMLLRMNIDPKEYDLE